MNANLHETDFYAWTRQQLHLLQTGRLSGLDVVNLIEEVEDMGGSIRSQLESRLGILLMHLLKWQFQPSHRGRSWQLTIKEQRRRIERLLRDNPSLKHNLEKTVEDAYGDAVIMAARETGLNETTFPKQCCYHLDNILDYEFLPEES
ncbi:DUF29 domain-containing protein [Methylomagnum sp.]